MNPDLPFVHQPHRLHGLMILPTNSAINAYWHSLAFSPFAITWSAWLHSYPKNASFVFMLKSRLGRDESFLQWGRHCADCSPQNHHSLEALNGIRCHNKGVITMYKNCWRVDGDPTKTCDRLGSEFVVNAELAQTAFLCRESAGPSRHQALSNFE